MGNTKLLRHQTRPFDERGVSIIEVLVATIIVVSFFLLSITFYAKQRATINNFDSLNQCRAVLDRIIARIDAGGGDYNLPQIGGAISFNNLSVSGSGLQQSYSIYNINLSSLSSQNPNNTRTYNDRFNQFLSGTPRLYDVIDNSGSSASYTRQSPMPNLVPDNDGVILYTPLLMQGAMADLAEVYDLPTYRGVLGALPAQFQSSVDQDSQKVMIQIDRFRLGNGSSSISNFTGQHFWPIPRMQFGNSGGTDPYSIREASDALLRKVNLGPGMRLASIPNDSANLSMSWDYGFLVTLKLKNYQPTTATTSASCAVQKEYSLSPAYHNTMNYQSDIAILTPAATSVQAQKLDTKLLTDKWDLLLSLGSGSPAYNKVYSIFSNVSANPADGFNDRPICSQDSSVSQKFKIRLKFLNLSKEPGAIPMCLDTSGIPGGDYGLTNSDGSDYVWCQGDVSGGAQVTIVSPKNHGASPGQQGWVPCEKLNLCHQAPDKVEVIGNSDTLEYDYTYSFANDNNGSGSRLWGCQMNLETAILDPVGNLTFITPSAATINTGDVQLGANRVSMSSVSPYIFFKPPPCYVCQCKNCKGGGSPGGFLGILLALIAIVVVVVFAPELLPNFSDIWGAIAETFSNLGGAYSAASATAIATGVIAGTGIALTATCIIQSTGVTNGGVCSTGGSKNNFSGPGYNTCRDSDYNCSCGHTCQKVVPPDPYGGTYDSNATPPKNAFCEYTTRAGTNSAGYSWIVQIGLHDTVGGGVDKKQTATIGQTAIYHMIDTVSGYYCISQNICSWDGATQSGVWKIATGSSNPNDPMSNQALEGCAKLKVGHLLKMGPASGQVTPDPAPFCFKPDIDGTLKDCSTNNFNCQAYNGSGVYSQDHLTTSFSPYINVAGHVSSPPLTASSATYGNYFPVQYYLPNCGSWVAVCGSGSSCYSHGSPISPPSSDGRTTAPNGSSYIYSHDCGSRSTAFTCPLSCSPVVTTVSTVSVGPPPVTAATYSGCDFQSGHGSCSLSGGSCIATPDTNCYNYEYKPWLSWNSCTPPPITTLSEYMISTSEMLCYDSWSPNTGLNSLCPENSSAASGGVTSTIPTFSTGAVDMVCPTGSCCNGSCP